MKIDHIFIDLDGVLVDWVGGVCDLLGEDTQSRRDSWPAGVYAIETALGISSERLWALVNRQGMEWWAHLEPLPTNRAFLSMLLDTTAGLSILTAPGLCDYSPTGKTRWVNHYAGRFTGRITTTHYKARLAKPGTLLIDDSDKECRAFIESGGQAIRFPQPWNSRFTHQENPLHYIRAELAALGVIS